MSPPLQPALSSRAAMSGRSSAVAEPRTLAVDSVLAVTSEGHPYDGAPRGAPDTQRSSQRTTLGGL